MTTSNALHQVGHEPLVPLVMVVIASSHCPQDTELHKIVIRQMLVHNRKKLPLEQVTYAETNLDQTNVSTR
jgi:hypothetical protein